MCPELKKVAVEVKMPNFADVVGSSKVTIKWKARVSFATTTMVTYFMKWWQS